MRAIRPTGPIPPAVLSLGAAGATLGIRRKRPPHKLIPLPISILLHGLILAVLIFAAHRVLKPPPVQPGIAVVFEGSGLTKTAPKTAAPRAALYGPPQRAANSAPPAAPPPAAAAPKEPHVSLASPKPVPNIPRALDHLPIPMPHAAPQNPAHRTIVRNAAPPFRIMNGMSFGHSAAAPSPFHRVPGHLAMQLSQSYLNRQSPDITFQGKAGPDWESAFNKWVNDHKYYPQSAAENNEQGSVTIAMTVLPDGSVRDLRLLRSAGAPLLDMAWLGLFQGGVHVPPFPPGSPAKQERIVATMRFVLIH
ncbi:MAG TPA: energy transducer TonB [Acidiphilium sp.]|nr:energy transducer TonB [Acidiphilium sp.]